MTSLSIIGGVEVENRLLIVTSLEYVDPLAGGNYGDEIHGGIGADEIHGGLGVDSIYGGEQGDSILGDESGDSLYGGSGHDTLSGGVGDDFVHGDFSVGGYKFESLSGIRAGTRIVDSVDDLTFAVHVSDGDVNGDGRGDVLVTSADSVYVVYGTGVLGAEVVVSDIDVTSGLRIGFSADFSSLASFTSSSFAGDLNGDGIGDLAIGTSFGDTYIIYGNAEAGRSSENVYLDMLSLFFYRR